MSLRPGIRSKPDDNESVVHSLAFLLDCYGPMLLWPTMAKLHSGSFVPPLLEYADLPDIKGSAAPRSLRETPIRSAAFLVSMTRDAVSQGDIAGLFDVYLQKPFSCEALMQVIEDAGRSSDTNTRQAAWKRT